MSALVARVPRPLGGLLAAVAIVGLAWALVMPAFAGPDEVQHYSYVETLVEQHRLPGTAGPDGPQPGVEEAGRTNTTVVDLTRDPLRSGVSNPVSTAVAGLMGALNGGGMTVGIARPEQSRPAFEAWKRAAEDQPADDGGGTFPGSTYPPGYYAFEAVGYSLAVGGNAVDRLYAARIWSILCLLFTTAGAWCLAGELLGRDRTLQLAAASVVGLWPMLTFVSSMVNPDALLYASWTWSFWAMAAVLKRGLTTPRLAILLAITSLALLTKETSIALVPAVAFVIATGFWRLRGTPRAVWQGPATLLALAAVVPLVAVLLLAGGGRPVLAQASSVLSGGVTNLTEFASYVWQYYFPRLPDQQLHDFWIPVVDDYPLYNVWIATAWAAFGWVTLYLPRSVYPWFLWTTVAVAAAAVSRLAFVLLRKQVPPALRGNLIPLLVAYGLAAGALLLGLHLTEYKLQSPTNQGRYLFPLAGLVGSALAGGLTWLPARFRQSGCATVVGLLVVFQFGCLAFVAGTYYA